MATQTIGRFGRLRQTLLDREKNKNLQTSCDTNFSYNKETTPSPSEPSENFVFAWLTICLEEEHIEPSQSKVGRVCGWPMRPFFCESLYIDFECWCIKRGCSPREIPSCKIFYALTDTIFIREGEKYFFPDLKQCRERFENLKKGKLNVRKTSTS